MADALERLELMAFPTADPAELYSAEELHALATEFPEGGVVGFDGDDRTNPVAVGLGVRTDFDFASPQHNVKTFFADAPTESGDDPEGDWYYGTDIVVLPEYRRRGIGRELYDLRKQICRDLGLRGIVAGGVIPGYAEHKHAMTADEYIVKVRRGELYDRTLTFQIGNGFEAVCGLRGLHGRSRRRQLGVPHRVAQPRGSRPMNEQPEGVEPLEPPGDQAFRRRSADELHHMQPEMTWGGALSFLRRAYTREPEALDAADIVITGIPFDMATSNRPGARLGPRAIRAASTSIAELPAYPVGNRSVRHHRGRRLRRLLVRLGLPDPRRRGESRRTPTASSPPTR